MKIAGGMQTSTTMENTNEELMFYGFNGLNNKGKTWFSSN